MRIDVVMLSYGEPKTPSFIEHWFYSNRILYKLTRRVAPIPKVAVPFIGAYRGWQRMRDWKQTNYRSPLEPITELQTQKIRRLLQQEKNDIDWRIHTVYEFRPPYFENYLNQLQINGGSRLVMVPLYVPYSAFTAEISLLDYKKFQAHHNDSLPPVRYVLFRPCLEELADLMTQYVKRKLEECNLDEQKTKKQGLLLGCHGTVITPPRGIKDTGYQDTYSLYQRLEARLAPLFKKTSIGWLNHRVGGEWTSPTLEDAIKIMLEDGIEQFVYFPYGFLADNAESQLEGKAVFEDLGIESYHHLDCINDDPAFMDFLAKRIIRTAGKTEPHHE